jgi:membrane protein
VAQNDTSEKKNSAPSPNDPRKPDSPGEVKKPSWKYALKKTPSSGNSPPTSAPTSPRR